MHKLVLLLPAPCVINRLPSHGLLLYPIPHMYIAILPVPAAFVIVPEMESVFVGIITGNHPLVVASNVSLPAVPI